MLDFALMNKSQLSSQESISLGLDISAAKDVAAKLLEIEAVFLRPNEPFTWASGIKSPIYCDNRLVISHPEVRALVIDSFLQLIFQQFSLDSLERDTEIDVIAGTATAGIPHAAWIAEKMNLPMIYVRSGSKSHGRENKIEGLLKEGQNVLLIEDLISTGGSSLAAADAIKESGGKVCGIAAIFSYQLQKAFDQFKQASADYGLRTYTLTNYDVLLEVALEKNLISQTDLTALGEWKADPETWGSWAQGDSTTIVP